MSQTVSGWKIVGASADQQLVQLPSCKLSAPIKPSRQRGTMQLSLCSAFRVRNLCFRVQKTTVSDSKSRRKKKKNWRMEGKRRIKEIKVREIKQEYKEKRRKKKKNRKALIDLRCDLAQQVIFVSPLSATTCLMS